MAGFRSPNYTQTPNDLFEYLMAEMGDAELRVVLAVIRGTFGFHRDEYTCSVSEMMRITGMSYNGVILGAIAAEKRGLIERVIDGKHSTMWRAVVRKLSTSSPSEGTDGGHDPHPVREEPSPSEGGLPHPVREEPSPSEGLSGSLNKVLNKVKEREIKDRSSNTTTTNEHSNFTDGQVYFLKTFEIAIYANSRQAAAVADLETKFPDTFRLGVDWAAENGMTPGQAIQRLKRALPKWIVGDKQKQPKDDSEESRNRYVSGPYADFIVH